MLDFWCGNEKRGEEVLEEGYGEGVGGVGV